MLTTEQKNDLRQKVLLGHQLSLEEARDVVESTRRNGATAILAAGESKASKKTKKVGLSDEALDADLAGLGL